MPENKWITGVVNPISGVKRAPTSNFFFLGPPCTWMSQEVRIRGDRISGLVHPNIQTIYISRLSEITH